MRSGGLDSTAHCGIIFSVNQSSFRRSPSREQYNCLVGYRLFMPLCCQLLRPNVFPRGIYISSGMLYTGCHNGCPIVAERL